jgi:hypothetical protein
MEISGVGNVQRVLTCRVDTCLDLDLANDSCVPLFGRQRERKRLASGLRIGVSARTGKVTTRRPLWSPGLHNPGTKRHVPVTSNCQP